MAGDPRRHGWRPRGLAIVHYRTAARLTTNLAEQRYLATWAARLRDSGTLES